MGGTNRLADVPGGRLVVACYVPQTAAGTDAYYPLLVLQDNITIKRVAILPHGGVTGQATNYFQPKIINRGTAGAGTTEMATGTAKTAGVDWTAEVPETLTLSSTAANLDLDAGEVLAYMSDQVAGGLIDKAKTVVIEYQLKD